MAGRRWDAGWQSYPASKPLPVEGGISTSKRRGAMAASWWSKRFVDVLDSYGLGGRMQRGRRYARSGQVLSLDVSSGLIVAQVQGSRRTPYVVTIRSPQPAPGQWAAIDAAMAARVGFAAHLAAGEVPAELENVFSAASVSLFPSEWVDIGAGCSCPDWENPCKHIAAVLYVFADRLDEDPWLLLLWRGRTREQVIDALRGRGAGSPGEEPERSSTGHSVAPWWPLQPGFSSEEPARQAVPVAEAPQPAHAILDRLAPLAADVGGTEVVDLLKAAYERLV